MRKVTRLVPLLLSLVLMFAAGVCLAATAAASQDSATKTTKTTATSATTKKTTVKSSAKKLRHALASAEELSGTITVVDPSDKEVILVGSNGVPYDFQVTRKTLVELGNKKLGANELAGESHRQATVHFLPTSRGNLAKSIQINAS